MRDGSERNPMGIWKTVTSGAGPDTKKLSVPGGWLTLVFVAGVVVGGPVFIADQTHSWTDGDTLTDAGAAPVADAGTPTPVVPNATKQTQIGQNLSSLVDYSTDRPFVNELLQARAWISGTSSIWDDGRTIAVDGRGYPTGLLAGQIGRLVVFTAARPAGDYVFTYAGSAPSLRVDGASVASSVPGKMVLTVPASGNLVINLLGGTITSASLVKADQSSSGVLFNPAWITDLKKYKVLRFMDWQRTNFSRTQTELNHDFDPLSALPISLSAGAPFEVMIEAANLADADLWVCMPVNSDAAYWTRALSLIKTKLKPGLRVWVESGNEIFNSQFAVNNVLGTDFNAKMYAHALRTGDLAAVVESTLGARGVTVLGAWQSVPWWTEESLKKIKDSGKTMPKAVAIGHYFGHSLSDDVTLFTSGAMLAEVNKAIALSKEHKVIADKYQVKLVAYEGSSHITDNGGRRVNADPRMTDMVTALLTAWASTTDGVFVNFSYVGSWGPYGSWGQRETFWGPNTPKGMAVEAFVASQK